MPKDKSDPHLSSTRSRGSSPDSRPSRNTDQCSSKSILELIGDEGEWEDTICPICVEHPHNAVLLICSSHEKGCWPYMCDTSSRHSNCFDQFRQTAPSSQSVDMGKDFLWSSSIQKLENKVQCPLCRGKISGWVVVEAARKLMNSKSRNCSLESCEFSGTYEELRKHARREHPSHRPPDPDPRRQQEWENERASEDFLGAAELDNEIENIIDIDDSDLEIIFIDMLDEFHRVHFLRTLFPDSDREGVVRDLPPNMDVFPQLAQPHRPTDPDPRRQQEWESERASEDFLGAAELDNEIENITDMDDSDLEIDFRNMLNELHREHFLRNLFPDSDREGVVRDLPPNMDVFPQLAQPGVGVYSGDMLNSNFALPLDSDLPLDMPYMLSSHLQLNAQDILIIDTLYNISRERNLSEDQPQPRTNSSEDQVQPGTNLNEDHVQPGTNSNGDEVQPGSNSNGDHLQLSAQDISIIDILKNISREINSNENQPQPRTNSSEDQVQPGTNLNEDQVQPGTNSNGDEVQPRSNSNGDQLQPDDRRL